MKEATKHKLDEDDYIPPWFKPYLDEAQEKFPVEGLAHGFTGNFAFDAYHTAVKELCAKLLETGDITEHGIQLFLGLTPEQLFYGNPKAIEDFKKVLTDKEKT